MTREEIIRNLEYTMEKHKNDTVATFGTNISLMCKDILSYLEQDPCEDAVSRQAVLHLINEDWKYEGLESDVANLPPVTPKPKTGNWIPVSERLPEDEEYVLVCYSNGHIITAYYYIDTSVYETEFEDLCETGWYNYTEEFMYDQDVVAWMPLPQPYKVEPQEREVCDV